MNAVEQNLANWKESLLSKIPVGGLLSRNPVAYKWKAPFRVWMLREAVAQFVEREEKRGAFRQAGLQAWQEYQATSKHVTHDETDAWLAKLEAGEEAAAPECHD